MRRKVLQGIACFTAFGMAFGQFAPGNRNVAEVSAYEKEAKKEKVQEYVSDFFTEEENHKENSINNEEEKTSYLIQTKTEKKYQQIQKHCDEEIAAEVESSEELEEEQIMVAQLTTGEAITIDGMSGVIVEKDEILKGASPENSSKEEEYIEAVEETMEEAWDIKAVNAEEVQEVQDTIKVAVLDSGYDKVGDIHCSGYENLVDPDVDINGGDLTGHGTAVTSVIMSGSQNRGTEGIINNKSTIELYSVKVLDGENQAPISRVIQGIQWCIDQEIDIINMSFGMTYHSTILKDAIEKAAKEGILMIASVGNTGETTGTVEYPAAFEEVVGVGSVNEKMEHSVFSATGEEVELVAPGENIPLSSYWGMVTVGSGTSYAAPHVTAIAALLWAKDSQKSSESIRGLLQKSARELGANEMFGYGLVDYEYASEIYKEYMASEQQNTDGDIEEDKWIEENDAPVQEYEVPEMVEASWHGKYHYNQVEDVPEATCYEKELVDYIMAGSIAPDRVAGNIDLSVSSYKNSSKHYDVLHARRNTNYVAATKCLLNAAIIIQDKSLGSLSVRIAKAEAFCRNNYICNEETKTKQNIDIQALIEAIHVACYYQLHKDVAKQANYLGEGVGAKRASHQLLGMAIHIATDAYSHRTIIPSKAGENTVVYSYEYGSFIYYEKYFTDRMKILEDITKEKITTSGIRSYVKDESGYITYIHQKIADNKEFLHLRYEQGSYFAIRELLFLFEYNSRKEELPYVFCPILLYKEHGEEEKYNLKLHNLKKNIEDIGYNLRNYPLITMTEWRSLSK